MISSRKGVANGRALGLLLIALLLVVPASSSRAESSIAPKLVSQLAQRGDLTLVDTDLPQALLRIGEAWSVNIVVGAGVKGSVNGSFHDATLSEILHAVLIANGYSYRAVGSSLVVIPAGEKGELHPLAESATIVLQNLQPGAVLQGAQLLTSAQGRVEAIESAGAIIVVDLPQHVKRVRSFVEELDRAAKGRGAVLAGPAHLEIDHFSPQFIPSSSLLPAVQSVLGPEGKATSVDSENQLVVLESAARLQWIRQLVSQLDQPRRQVRITALIYDASVEDMERMGFNWRHGLKSRLGATGEPNSLWSVESMLQAPAAAGDPSGVMTLMNLSRHVDVTAIIDALNTSQQSKLLADPSVAVVDREMARIQIVSEIPFQQLTQTAAGGNIGTTAFREAGVTLTVTPHIAHDHTIMMKVLPTFSRLVGFTSGASPQPIINKRQAETTVRVANQQTLVIGGLRQRGEIDEFRGIPKLKDIRRFSIGKLFRSYETSRSESELIVFLTPEIITPVYCGKPHEAATYHDSRQQLNVMAPYGVAGSCGQVYGSGESLPAPLPDLVPSPDPALRQDAGPERSLELHLQPQANHRQSSGLPRYVQPASASVELPVFLRTPDPLPDAHSIPSSGLRRLPRVLVDPRRSSPARLMPPKVPAADPH